MELITLHTPGIAVFQPPDTLLMPVVLTLSSIYNTTVEVTDSGNYSSLLGYGINYIAYPWYRYLVTIQYLVNSSSLKPWLHLQDHGESNGQRQIL
jgi:hypothetical protein